MTDTERLDWIEAHQTLHYDVEFKYVVDGYEARLTYDCNELFTGKGDDIRQAIDRLATIIGNGKFLEATPRPTAPPHPPRS